METISVRPIYYEVCGKKIATNEILIVFDPVKKRIVSLTPTNSNAAAETFKLSRTKLINGSLQSELRSDGFSLRFKDANLIEMYRRVMTAMEDSRSSVEVPRNSFPLTSKHSAIGATTESQDRRSSAPPKRPLPMGAATANKAIGIGSAQLSTMTTYSRKCTVTRAPPPPMLSRDTSWDDEPSASSFSLKPQKSSPVSKELPAKRKEASLLDFLQEKRPKLEPSELVDRSALHEKTARAEEISRLAVEAKLSTTHAAQPFGEASSHREPTVVVPARTSHVPPSVLAQLQPSHGTHIRFSKPSPVIDSSRMASPPGSAQTDRDSVSSPLRTRVTPFREIFKDPSRKLADSTHLNSSSSMTSPSTPPPRNSADKSLSGSDPRLTKGNQNTSSTHPQDLSGNGGRGKYNSPISIISAPPLGHGSFKLQSRLDLSDDDEPSTPPINRLESVSRNSIWSYMRRGSSLSGFRNPGLPGYGGSVAASKYMTGMRNMGNTCYISSLLQALFCVRNFSEELTSPLLLHLFSKDEDRAFADSSSLLRATVTPPSPDENGHQHDQHQQKLLQPHQNTDQTSLVNAFQVLYRKWKAPDHGILDLQLFKRIVDEKTLKYKGYRQQDAHEFLLDLLNLISDEVEATVISELDHGLFAAQGIMTEKENAGLQSNYPGTLSTHVTPGAVLSLQADSGDLSPDDFILDQASPSTLVERTAVPRYGPLLSAILNPVARQFHGLQAVHFRCLRCHQFKDTVLESFRCFSLDLNVTSRTADGSGNDDGDDEWNSSEETAPLTQLWSQFFHCEHRNLDCDKCGASSVPNEVVNQLRVLPNCLILHLKRFHYDFSASTFRKLKQKVHVPIQFRVDAASLDATAFVPPSAPPQEVAEKAKPADRVEIKAYDRQLTLWRTALSSHSISQAALDLAQIQSQHETLDIESFMTPIKATGDGTKCCSTTSIQYRLVAVLRHMGGNPFSGHYISDVWKRDDQSASGEFRWFRCNDSSVVPINVDSVIEDKESPYLLFYSRLET